MSAGDIVESEAILLTAREVVIFILVVAILLWVAFQLVREQRR